MGDLNSKQHKKITRSSISDEELALLIEEDRRRNPSDFTSGPVVFSDTFPNSKYFFENTSARGIEQLMKWL